MVEKSWGSQDKQHPAKRVAAPWEHGLTVLAPTGQQFAWEGPQQTALILVAAPCLSHPVGVENRLAGRNIQYSHLVISATPVL